MDTVEHPNLPGGTEQQPLVAGQAPQAPTAAGQDSPSKDAAGKDITLEERGTPGLYQSPVIRGKDDQTVGDEFEGQNTNGRTGRGEPNAKNQSPGTTSKPLPVADDPTTETQKSTTSKA